MMFSRSPNHFPQIASDGTGRLLGQWLWLLFLSRILGRSLSLGDRGESALVFGAKCIQDRVIYICAPGLHAPGSRVRVGADLVFEISSADIWIQIIYSWKDTKLVLTKSGQANSVVHEDTFLILYISTPNPRQKTTAHSHITQAHA